VAPGLAAQRRSFLDLRFPRAGSEQQGAMARPAYPTLQERQWLAKRLGQWSGPGREAARPRQGQDRRNASGKQELLAAYGLTEAELPEFVEWAKGEWKEWKAKRSKLDRESDSSGAEF